MIVTGVLALIIAVLSAMLAAGAGGQLQDLAGATPAPGDAGHSAAVAGTMSWLALASGAAVLMGAAGLAFTGAGIAWLIWRKRASRA